MTRLAWLLWEKVTGRRYFASCDYPDNPNYCDGSAGMHTCSVILVGYIDRKGVVHVDRIWEI